MPRSIDGLHTFTNSTDEQATVLAVSTMPVPEVVLCPEIRKLGAATRTPLEPVPEGGDTDVVGLFDLTGGQERWKNRTLDGSRGKPYPSLAMLLGNVMNRKLAGGCSAGPRGR